MKRHRWSFPEPYAAVCLNCGLHRRTIKRQSRQHGGGKISVVEHSEKGKHWYGAREVKFRCAEVQEFGDTKP